MLEMGIPNTKYEILDIHGHHGSFNSFHAPYAGEDSLVEIMDRLGMAKICIAPFLGLTVDFKAGNDATYVAMQKYPERILGHACVNPYHAGETERELVKCFEVRGFHAIKLHPDFNGCEPQYRGFEPVFEYAQANSLTILWHCGASEAYLRKLAERYDRVNFVLAHYGGAWNGYNEDRTLELVRDIPNLYTDIASSVAYNGAFSRLIEYVGEDKVLFGSDMVFLDAGFQLGRVLLCDVPEEAKRKVLGENCRKLLNRNRFGRTI